MSKGERKGSKPLIDLSAVMDNIPTIMGLNLKRKGENKWEGGYYMNRERHPYRRDKLKVTIWNYNIWVHEEGSQSMSLATWLVQFGGASDYKEAYRIMRGNAIPIFQEFHSVGKEGLYVPEEVYNEYHQYPLEGCNLFTWMCRLFGEQRVKEVWERYGVTTDYHGNAVFWVRDVDGNICHDKRIKYLQNGKRDKQFGAMRKFKVGDGFTNKAYFGSHLIEDGKPINVTESEKSCLLGALYYGGIWISCGGKGNLRDVDENMILYSDLDAVDEWLQKGGILAEWWLDEDCKGLGENADIGDLIVAKMMKNN